MPPLSWSWRILFKKLKGEGLEGLYSEIEMPLIRVLADMETVGIKVDTELLSDLSGELERELAALQTRIYFLAGEEFNINSPRQLGAVLFDSLGLKPGKKTKTGYSTEVGVLEELALEHELPGEILNWRTLSKLKNTYVDSLQKKLVSPVTGRIHTSFNQTVTATGRLSSSDPNLQNIPIRGEWGIRIRQAFIAEEGFFLLSADYSQIELRILAHLSRDEGLIDAFRQDIDIHTRTAAELFGVSREQVTPEMRRVAKTVNFGVYGMSAFGLSGAIGSSREDARVYIEQYFEKHPGVRRYVEQIIEEAKRAGYVRTLFGRKREIPELRSSNAQKRAFGERLAMNTPIQGTAADIIKKAMINTSNRLKAEGLQSRMLLQVHDELVLEV
ncbi:MAG: DNA polymerase I, partial [Nitrospirae bacterium]|nr:DNA polymerase I [Nitrospirota bacterium]